MKMTIRFQAPKDVTRPYDDTVSYLFEFEMLNAELVNSPEEAQAKTDHRLIVTATRNRIAAWRLSPDALVRVLFEIGKRDLLPLLSAGEAPREHRVLVSTDTHSSQCPFDPTKIDSPHGSIVAFDIEKRIGFKCH